MAGFENNIVYSNGERLQTSTSRDIARMQQSVTDVSRVNYSGNPESNVSANPSSLCHDPTTGNAYVKLTGTGNTGWIPFSGLLILGGIDIDFTVLDSVTTLFSTVNKTFLVMGIMYYGVDITGLTSNAFLNYGWTAPDYDDLLNDATAPLSNIGSNTGKNVFASIGQSVTAIPPLTEVKIKVDVASVATTDVNKISILGFYI